MVTLKIMIELANRCCNQSKQRGKKCEKESKREKREFRGGTKQWLRMEQSRISSFFFFNSWTLTDNQVEIAPTQNYAAKTGNRSAARTEQGQLSTRRVVVGSDSHPCEERREEEEKTKKARVKSES